MLVPTRELAKQVVDVLAPLGKEIGMPRRRVLRRHVDGQADPQPAAAASRVAVATPGRMIDLLERDELDLDQVAHRS